MINISKIISNNNKPKLVVQNLDNDIGYKLYLPINVSFLHSPFARMGGLLDTGADISIIQSSYFFKLFKEIDKDKLLQSLDKSSFTLTSYTEHTIKVLGLAKVQVKINSYSPTKSLDLYVVQTMNEDSCKSPVIFSFKILSEFGLTMSFSNIDNLNTPHIYQREQMIPSYFCTDAQLSTCIGYVDELKPNESKHIYFVISPVSPFLPGDKVILSQDEIPYEDQKQIKLSPSTSILEMIGADMIAHGYVTNLGKNIFTGGVKGSLSTFDKNYEIQTLEKNTLLEENVSLITECRPKYELEQTVMRIALKKSLKKSLKKISLKEQIVDPKLYNLNVNFPEFSPDLANPDCENNDVKDFSKSLSEERHSVNESKNPLTQQELDKFNDPKETIQLGFNYNLPEINKDYLEPEGIGIPDSLIEQPEDIVKKEEYEPIVWPYIDKIFLKKYPEVISRHSLDRGRISDTLGYYNIVLKPHTTLPKFKKLYYLDPKSASQMRDILEFLVKTKVIAKAPCSGGDGNTFASPAFLVARSNKQQAARIVVNFMHINQCIVMEPITLTNLDFILNQLRDATLFSVIDLKSAFQSINLSADSTRLTTFSTIYGSYNFLVLPTGMACSPNSLARFVDKMIHHDVERDKDGNIKYDKSGYPFMIPSKIIGCEIYYDDIILFSKAAPTYAETLKLHFDLVEKVVKRLAFHKAKLEMSKAKFGKHKINFLGWFICNDTLIADPKRIEKLNATPFPGSVKAMRSYLGLLNCLRNTLNFSILRKIHLLTPLTSSKLVVYKASEEQRETFGNLNKILGSAPLYSKLVIPGSPKVLFTDSASEAFSQFSCVLGQIVKPKNPKTIVPHYLLLDDVCDRIIYDHKLPVKPVPLKVSNENDKEYLKRIQLKDPPCLEYYLEDSLGYGSKVDNSLGITLQHMLILHNCTQPYLEVCAKMHDIIKKSIYNEQLLQNIFQGDRAKYNLYLSDVKAGILYLDKEFYILRALGDALYRTIGVINSTKSFGGEEIVTFNPGKPKPPFYVKVYYRNNKYIARPLKLDPHSEYNIGKHSGSFEVIFYYSKTIPESYKNAKIFDLELFALLSSLEAVKKVVGQDELLCLVDNRALYWLYHADVAASFSKLCRWGAKIKESFPALKLHFVSSSRNISDFLSRQLQVSKSDFKQVKLPNYVNSLLDDHIPENKIFTLAEWIEWVSANPQFLEYITPPKLQNKLKKSSSVKSPSHKDKSTELIDNFKVQQDLDYNKNKYANNYFTNHLKKQSNSVKQNINKITTKYDSNTNKIVFNRLEGLDKLRAKVDEMGLCKLKLEILATSKKKKKINLDDIPQQALGMNLSQKFLVRNADAFYNPIKSLEKQITLERIINDQKEEYSEIYGKCLRNFSKAIQIKSQKYEIHDGILHIIKKDNLPKMYIPTSLLPMYISMAHLSSNHAGSRSMILSMTNYYHPDLQKQCEKFARTCLACTLVNHPNRGSKLGVFPLDTQVGEALYIDLMENVGSSSGFQHILTIKCPISQYLMLQPMKSKRADEFLHIFTNFIWPFFKPKILYCDNAGFFTSEITLVTLTKLRTALVYSSAFASYSHGSVERMIKHIKLIFKKILTAEPNYNWTLMPAIASQIHNSTKVPKSGYSPAEILYGPDNHMSQSFLDKEFPRIHPFLRNRQAGLELLHNLTQKIWEDNKDKIINERDQRIRISNRNRILQPLEEGDIVFVKDQTKLTGGTRPLKAYYHNSPFIVLHVRPASAVIKRISDSIVIKRNRGQLKKYKNLPQEFKEVLPAPVLRICEQGDFNITQEQIDALIKEEAYDFEHFYDQEDEEDKLDTISMLEDITKNPPPPPIKAQKTQLKEQILNEDKEDDFLGVKTQGQKEIEIEKRLRFDLDKNQEHEENNNDKE